MPTRTTRKRHPRRKLKTYRKKAKSYKKRTHRIKQGGKYGVDRFGFDIDSPRKNNSSGSYGFEDDIGNDEIFTPKKKSIKRPSPLVGDFGEKYEEEVKKLVTRTGAIKRRTSPKITRSHHPTLGQVTTFGV